MIIINQDRDARISLQKKEDIKGQVIIKDNTYIGINLVYKDKILGTFDTFEEFITELININNCTYRYYVVNGFSDYDNCFKEVN